MSGTLNARMRGALRAATALAAAGALAGLATPAQAALIGTLSFSTPTGIVGATDAIDVYMTLTLDDDSDALVTNEYGNILSGITDENWEDIGVDPTQVAGSYLNVFFECSGTFTTVCIDGPPYDFNFAPISIPQSDIDLQPGESLEFLFGTFTPNGPVAPGTYTFYNVGITANPYDAQGNYFPDPTYGYPLSYTLFQSCPGQNPDCAFTRTVEASDAVPEPASWALMIGGFALAGGAMRRRRALSVSFA